MTILVIGINHKTAPIELRERIYFAPENTSLYLQDILTRGFTQEAVLLSTCNRSELYCETDDIEQAKTWFCSQHALPLEALTEVMYIHQDATAIAHIMSVACGLDSMVLGEPQILGQMKTAYSESCTANAVGSLFHRLFQEVFAVAKEVRTNTAVGACPVSIASSALHFAKKQIPALQDSTVLVIGAGETAELLLRYLKAYGIRAAIVNRTPDKAAELAVKYDGYPHSLHELPQLLATADLVLSATGSALPVITHAMLAPIVAARQSQSLLILDMAVPRDVETSVGQLTGVELYCIDDLKNIIEEHRQGREHAANKARECIEHKSRDFMFWLTSLDRVNHTIRACREHVEAICKSELLKAKQQLAGGTAPEQVLEFFSRSLANRLLHNPSVQLRQAGADGQLELLQLAKRFFALPDREVDPS